MAQARDIEITHEQLRVIQQPVADYLCVKPLVREPGPCVRASSFRAVRIRLD
jgi:hypothetical protein